MTTMKNEVGDLCLIIGRIFKISQRALASFCAAFIKDNTVSKMRVILYSQSKFF